MENKLVVIAGMGKGISRAVAYKFGGEGYKIAMIARNENALMGYRDELRAVGIESQYFTADLGNEREIKKAFADIFNSMGNAGVLVYNAAATKMKGILGEDTESLVEDFKINVAGALICIKEVLPGMKNVDKGTIIFTGGGLSLTPHPNYGSLAIGKAGIKNLTQSIAKLLEGTGVKAGTITICGFVNETDEKYNPAAIAEKYWEIHTSLPNGTDIIY